VQWEVISAMGCMDKQVATGRSSRDSLGGYVLLPEVAVSFRIRRALVFVNRSYSDCDISLAKIGAACGLSRSHLSRQFKRELGLGLRAYIRRLRLTTAADLLSRSSLSIKEISAAVGYKHVSDLDRQFRCEYELCPTTFRRERMGVI
jgi:transcriptional regulator GlxA family with amidase domain